MPSYKEQPVTKPDEEPLPVGAPAPAPAQQPERQRVEEAQQLLEFAALAAQREQREKMEAAMRAQQQAFQQFQAHTQAQGYGAPAQAGRGGVPGMQPGQVAIPGIPAGQGAYQPGPGGVPGMQAGQGYPQGMQGVQGYPQGYPQGWQAGRGYPQGMQAGQVYPQGWQAGRGYAQGWQAGQGYPQGMQAGKGYPQGYPQGWQAGRGYPQGTQVGPGGVPGMQAGRGWPQGMQAGRGGVPGIPAGQAGMPAGRGGVPPGQGQFVNVPLSPAPGPPGQQPGHPRPQYYHSAWGPEDTTEDGSDMEPTFWRNPFTNKSVHTGIDKKFTKEHQNGWLNSSANWPDTLPENEWKGVKVLGLGGFGLVGLWKYTGSDPNQPKAIVVKQSRGKDADLRLESNILEKLNACGTKHIPKLLKGYHECVGSGTSKWDMEGQTVSRIYMEFCEHGDMAGFIKKMYKRYTRENPMPEAYIWRIFECLALAVCVMATGSENLEGPAWNAEICHFDIKPQNIFIGACDDEHPHTGVFKLGDYGLAVQVPAEQTPAWIEDNVGRGTPGWTTIDQHLEKAKNRRFGNHTNIYAIALIMYSLIMRGRQVEWSTPVRRDIYGHRINVVGAVKLEKTAYSDDLKNTLLWCLAVNWERRPTARQLVKHIKDIISDKFPEVPSPGEPLHDPSTLLQERGPPSLTGQNFEWKSGEAPEEKPESSPEDSWEESSSDVDMANVDPGAPRPDRTLRSAEFLMNMEISPRTGQKRPLPEPEGSESEEGGEGEPERQGKRRQAKQARWW